MKASQLLLQADLPIELSAHLINYLEKRVPQGKYSQGELEKRLLMCAVHIAKHYKWKTSCVFKELVKELVSMLVEIYSHLARESGILPSDYPYQNSIQTFMATENEAPP